MRIANANVAKASATTQDNKQQKRKRTEDEGRRRRGKTFGRGPKYLTLQMKWQNVESNAQTAQNVSQRRDAVQRGKKPQSSRGQGRERRGTIKTEPKDATRTDSNKIKTNATRHGTAKWATGEGLRGGRDQKEGRVQRVRGVLSGTGKL